MATAKQLAARKRFAEMAKSGVWRKNPAKKAAKPAKKASKSVKRPSQASGKPPTKRLVKRRTKTATAPKGFFANPEKRAPTTFKVRVEKAAFDSGPWKFVAGFIDATLAKQYARALAKNGDYFIRVVS